MATDPTGRISHVQDMHRGLTWKPACRVATTATITISTALNNGDTIDGVTLATGDRVLVKDQSSAAENGIYIVGATPTRAADMDQDGTTAVPAEEIAGAVVFVISGTTNTKTIWYTTNAVGGTVGSTSIVWSQFTGGASSLTVKDEGSNLDTAVTSLDFVGAGVTATNSSHAITVTIPGASAAAFSGARVYNSGNVALTSGIETVLTFDSERYDTAAYHSTVTNTDRLTVPTTGYYHIGANARITNSPGDPSYILLQANGTTTIALDFIANNGSIPMGLVSCDYQLTAGDYVKVFVFVNAGSKNATANGNYSPEFWCHLIGA